jgi:hypothetical protein
MDTGRPRWNRVAGKGNGSARYSHLNDTPTAPITGQSLRDSIIRPKDAVDEEAKHFPSSRMLLSLESITRPSGFLTSRDSLFLLLIPGHGYYVGHSSPCRLLPIGAGSRRCLGQQTSPSRLVLVPGSWNKILISRRNEIRQTPWKHPHFQGAHHPRNSLSLTPMLSSPADMFCLSHTGPF